eukprot:CAMPEP_0175902170 /NCGR_PEP_ID=MMETSP0108-20121206/3249_1 /TAXON_ID=195067 ORGANISM="Goniomonas pacifica, Strain CCMP1869" /NCGR_SAMPLE_ID=MMETSP0108 /ASSEMBLY_ACC=CAM_ASM_000204 /LENGTH=84 /DNA_ID=CAMNT_0017223795 /DNA_START=201 /DNA_END=452 /DNA_ORIENTATION=+
MDGSLCANEPCGHSRNHAAASPYVQEAHARLDLKVLEAHGVHVRSGDVEAEGMHAHGLVKIASLLVGLRDEALSRTEPHGLFDA